MSRSRPSATILRHVSHIGNHAPQIPMRIWITFRARSPLTHLFSLATSAKKIADPTKKQATKSRSAISSMNSLYAPRHAHAPIQNELSVVELSLPIIHRGVAQLERLRRNNYSAQFCTLANGNLIYIEETQLYFFNNFIGV